jgi:hypothetical protein
MDATMFRHAMPSVPPAPRRARRTAPRRESAMRAPLRGLLVHCVVLAAARALDGEIEPMRRALAHLGVDRARLNIAIAMVKLQRGDSVGCLAWLEQQVLAEDPHHELALAVQASAWRLQGRPQCRMQASALLSTSADPLVRAVANASL